MLIVHEMGAITLPYFFFTFQSVHLLFPRTFYCFSLLHFARLFASSPEVPSHKNQEVLDPESTAPPTSAPAASEPEVPPAPQAFNGLSAYQRARAAMFMSDDR